MGSRAGEEARQDDEQQVSVVLSRSFWMQSTPVTQGQWTALSGGINPSCFQSLMGASCSENDANPSGPVESMTWWSALGYANALSASEGLPKCYMIPANGCSGTWQEGTLNCEEDEMPAVNAASVYECTGYRLPTEAEWEYAARAGTTTATYNGDLAGTSCEKSLPVLDAISWYVCSSNSGDERRTRPVGGREPNPWGLYDMLGNVWEWTWDRYVRTLQGGTNPSWESDGPDRVRRGGSWSNGAQVLRAAHRGDVDPGYRFGGLGLRLVRTEE